MVDPYGVVAANAAKASLAVVLLSRRIFDDFPGLGKISVVQKYLREVEIHHLVLTELVHEVLSSGKAVPDSAEACLRLCGDNAREFERLFSRLTNHPSPGRELRTTPLVRAFQVRFSKEATEALGAFLDSQWRLLSTLRGILSG
jgi:hypothetical protein